MTEPVKYQPKKERLRQPHKSVEEYVDYLNALSFAQKTARYYKSHRSLCEFTGIDPNVVFECTSGTDQDFKGWDIVAALIRIQDKLRKKSEIASEVSGRDIGLEIVRMYLFSFRGKGEVVLDWGRDLYQIPNTALQLTFNPQLKQFDGREGRYVVDRDLDSTECISDFYVTHPADEDFSFWAESLFIKKVGKAVAKMVFNKFGGDFKRQEDEDKEDEDYYGLDQSIVDSIRFGRGTARQLTKFLLKKDDGTIKQGLDCWAVHDVDQKDVVIEGEVIPKEKVKIAKINLYIDPRTGVIGQEGQHFICFPENLL